MNITREHADARAGIPMNAGQVREYIREMEAETKSKAARIALARAAIRLGNITEDGKAVYREYLAALVR